MAQTASDTQETHWPVFRSLRAFRASDLPGDLIAGLTLAAIAESVGRDARPDIRISAAVQSDASEVRCDA